MNIHFSLSLQQVVLYAIVTLSGVLFCTGFMYFSHVLFFGNRALEYMTKNWKETVRFGIYALLGNFLQIFIEMIDGVHFDNLVKLTFIIGFAYCFLIGYRGKAFKEFDVAMSGQA